MGGVGKYSDEVALLAEGVDRNIARLCAPLGVCVALLAEGVDRNLEVRLFGVLELGRPPRGGRG